jgi:hypothetical protein
MSGNVGARVVSDTGSTTGIATAILALLSAGTMASISLVGAHQLALPGPGRLRSDAPSVVRAPATVIVTPHAAAPSGAEPAAHHATKTHRSSATDVGVAPAVLTSHAPPHKVALGSSPGAQVSPPQVTLPTVAAPVPTVLPTPVVTPTPEPTAPNLPYPKLSPEPVPTVPIHTHGSGGKPSSTRVDAYRPSRRGATAVLGKKIGTSRGQSNACGEHSSRDSQQSGRSVAGHATNHVVAHQDNHAVAHQANRAVGHDAGHGYAGDGGRQSDSHQSDSHQSDSHQGGSHQGGSHHDGHGH